MKMSYIINELLEQSENKPNFYSVLIDILKWKSYLFEDNMNQFVNMFRVYNDNDEIIKEQKNKFNTNLLKGLYWPSNKVWDIVNIVNSVELYSSEMLKKIFLLASILKKQDENDNESEGKDSNILDEIYSDIDIIISSLDKYETIIQKNIDTILNDKDKWEKYFNEYLIKWKYGVRINTLISNYTDAQSIAEKAQFIKKIGENIVKNLNWLYELVNFYNTKIVYASWWYSILENEKKSATYYDYVNKIADSKEIEEIYKNIWMDSDDEWCKEELAKIILWILWDIKYIDEITNLWWDKFANVWEYISTVYRRELDNKENKLSFAYYKLINILSKTDLYIKYSYFSFFIILKEHIQDFNDTILGKLQSDSNVESNQVLKTNQAQWNIFKQYNKLYETTYKILQEEKQIDNLEKWILTYANDIWYIDILKDNWQLYKEILLGTTKQKWNVDNVLKLVVSEKQDKFKGYLTTTFYSSKFIYLFKQIVSSVGSKSLLINKIKQVNNQEYVKTISNQENFLKILLWSWWQMNSGFKSAYWNYILQFVNTFIDWNQYLKKNYVWNEKDFLIYHLDDNMSSWSKRWNLLDSFKKAKANALFVTTIGRLTTWANLPMVKDVYIDALVWKYSDIYQFYSRAFRLDTKHTVNVRILVNEWSFDNMIFGMLLQKEIIWDLVKKGNIDVIKSPEKLQWIIRMLGIENMDLLIEQNNFKKAILEELKISKERTSDVEESTANLYDATEFISTMVDEIFSKETTEKLTT